MTKKTLDIVVLLFPVAIGGIVAALNSNQVNDATETAEAWVRRRQQLTAASNEWFSRYVINPALWVIVKFSDWTDGFTHRGLKNGTRVAATLYVVAVWLMILYAAFIIAVALVMLAVGLYIALKVMGSSASESCSGRGSDSQADKDSGRESALDLAGLRGNNVYSGTNWFTEELKGRVDEQGNLYRGTNWFAEERIGRIDNDGTIYEGNGFMSETIVGRIDKDGTLYKGSNWFTEQVTGRIDEDGTIHKGTNWLNERPSGRIGR